MQSSTKPQQLAPRSRLSVSPSRNVTFPPPVVVLQSMLVGAPRWSEGFRWHGLEIEISAPAAQMRGARMPVQELMERLMDARYALAGLNFRNEKIHPALGDADVISFADGNGIRRPHASIFGAAVQALLESAQWSLDDYMFLQPHRALTRAVLGDMHAFGLDRADEGNIVIGAGTTHLFNLALRAATNYGDTVLVPRSFYHELPAWCAAHHLELEILPTTSTTMYKLDPDLLTEALPQLRRTGRNPGTLVVFNPTQTGAIYSPTELRNLAIEAERQNLFVIEDCVFAGTEFPGQPRVQPLCSMYHPADHSFLLLRGVSKTHNLPNLRIGYAYGDNSNIAKIRRVLFDTLASVPWLNQSLAAAALAAPSSYLQENANEYHARATIIESYIASLAADIGQRRQTDDCPISVLHSPQAGHGLLVKFTHDAEDEPGGTASVRIARSLLRVQKVGIGPASSLGFVGAGEARIGFASVGLKSTYHHSAAAETEQMLMALAAVVRQHDERVGAILLDAAKMFATTGPTPDTPPETVWEDGRRLIISGMQRIEKYLYNFPRLVRSHGQFAG